MAVQIDEKTEVTLPLKIVIGMGIALVSAAGFVFHVEDRISSLEATLTRKAIQWDAAGKFVTEFKPHPLVNETAERVRDLELEIVKHQKDIEYLQKHIVELKQKGK
jgi:cell division protein FtsL